MPTMRSTSACTCTFQPLPGRRASMLTGICPRRWPKPECISAQTERARARARASSGQTLSAGKRSARYSTIASVSQTAKSPSSSTGTRPAGDTFAISVRKASPNSGSTRSRNGMPRWRISSQGRSDHDE
jgi:hypothetical protein